MRSIFLRTSPDPPTILVISSCFVNIFFLKDHRSMPTEKKHRGMDELCGMDLASSFVVLWPLTFEMPSTHPWEDVEKRKHPTTNLLLLSYVAGSPRKRSTFFFGAKTLHGFSCLFQLFGVAWGDHHIAAWGWGNRKRTFWFSRGTELFTVTC